MTKIIGITGGVGSGKSTVLNFLEKEAIKLAVKKAGTVGDLLKTALDLLKK